MLILALIIVMMVGTCFSSLTVCLCRWEPQQDESICTVYAQGTPVGRGWRRHWRHLCRDRQILHVQNRPCALHQCKYGKATGRPAFAGWTPNWDHPDIVLPPLLLLFLTQGMHIKRLTQPEKGFRARPNMQGHRLSLHLLLNYVRQGQRSSRLTHLSILDGLTCFLCQPFSFFCPLPSFRNIELFIEANSQYH